MNFYDRLHLLCKEHNTTVSGMLSELGLSTGSTGNWKKGQLPKGDILVAIAKYLNTSIDYIILGKYYENISDEDKHLLEIYHAVPERAKYKILCDLEKMVNIEIEKYALEKSQIKTDN